MLVWGDGLVGHMAALILKESRPRKPEIFKALLLFFSPEQPFQLSTIKPDSVAVDDPAGFFEMARKIGPVYSESTYPVFLLHLYLHVSQSLAAAAGGHGCPMAPLVVRSEPSRTPPVRASFWQFVDAATLIAVPTNSIRPRSSERESYCFHQVLRAKLSSGVSARTLRQPFSSMLAFISLSSQLCS